MKKRSLEDPDPNIRRRAKIYLEESVYPVLEPYKEHFPSIFPINDDSNTLDLDANDCRPAKQ